MVVDSQFLLGLNRAKAHVEDVTFDDSRHHVWLAAVIQVLRAGTADGAIDRPVGIEREQVDEIACIRAAFGFTAVDLLARIFYDLPVGRNQLGRIDSPAVNLGGGGHKPEARVLGSIRGEFSESVFLPPADCVRTMSVRLADLRRIRYWK